MPTHSAAESGRGAADGTSPRPVVTIWGQYGAGAEAIGRVVAERLGLPYHEQAFSSEEIAGGTDAGSLKNRATLAQVFSAMGGAYGGFEGRDVVTTQKEKRDLVADNNDTVWRYAEEGGVIIGRNATVILAARPRTVHVLLTGDVKDRVQRAAEATGIPVDKAARRQGREDQVRADMSRVLYGWDPHDPARYDLVINTSRIPELAVANVIVDVIESSTR
ncbi:AAA family ATPase [Pseudactinotalea sp. Z1748]|uniref:cytidylate kinase-like family protein n=1 Tax=Pseudactinotalea sp. Z1748 TaxID=3413027 RepID=UPI003C7A122D